MLIKIGGNWYVDPSQIVEMRITRADAPDKCEEQWYHLMVWSRSGVQGEVKGNQDIIQGFVKQIEQGQKQAAKSKK